MEKNMSKLNRLEAYLKSGASATPKQIQRMFGLVNHTAAIFEMRKRGLLVYANKTTLADGTQTTKYAIGEPTRRMVQTLHMIGYFKD